MLAPHDPYELGVPYLRPSAEHPSGPNDIGQDILSELIYGTRISLLIGVVSALAVTVVGTALGILSGYLGGWTDQIIMQVTNVAMALPSLPLTIILVAFLDASVWNIILGHLHHAWTSTARIIRSGSSEKVTSGSHGVRMIPSCRSRIPSKGSTRRPKSSSASDQAIALMVKSRRRWSSSSVPASTCGLRESRT